MPRAEVSTASLARASSDWQRSGLATQWAAGDRLEAVLALPRRITSDLLAHSEDPVRSVLDVGSGPGAFLTAVLERLPEARGTWTDVSQEMCDIARDRLAGFADRVEFRILDADAVSTAGTPGSFDAVVTSRLTHHLGPAGLAKFYGEVATLLGPRGWVANLDHVDVGQPWTARLALARADVIAPNPSAHHHDRPHPTLDDHLQALEEVGGFDVVVPWRAYSTVLVVGQRR